jgi:AcrR family transcriptional regulator
MSIRQRSPTASPDVRTRILDSTEQLMLDEGYAGVSSRKVAVRAGLKSNLLHYYYRSMDDLFIAVFRRREEWHFAHFAAAAASDKPLHALWALGMDAASSKLNLEFNALACHRPALREVIGRSAIRDRAAVASALQTVFDRYGIDSACYPPRLVAMTMAALARSLAIERALGVDQDHHDARTYIDDLLRLVEASAGSGPASRNGSPAG